MHCYNGLRKINSVLVHYKGSLYHAMNYHTKLIGVKLFFQGIIQIVRSKVAGNNLKKIMNCDEVGITGG